MITEHATTLLATTKLSNLLKPQHVTTIQETSSVDHALRVLASHRILSAPVVSMDIDTNVEHRETSEPHERIREVAGFIDIKDILISFLQDVDLPTLKDAKMLKRMRILEERGAAFASKPIKQLKCLGSDGWFYNLKAAQHASLREIIYNGFLHPKDSKGLFGGSRSRQVVHRLALFDANGQLTNVVSQSDMVKYLFQHIKDIGILADTTVADLGFVSGHDRVVCVRPETPALDAMVLMSERDISAIAVVNNDGSIIGNFSVSELRTIMAEHFGSLALPVGEFLALEHGTEYAGYVVQRDSSSSSMDLGGSRPGSVSIKTGTEDGSNNGNAGAELHGTSPGPSGAGFQFVQERDLRRRESHTGADVGQTLITCSPESRFSEVLEKIVSNKLHRVYVCDDAFKPCGVITLTDILRRLVG